MLQKSEVENLRIYVVGFRLSVPGPTVRVCSKWMMYKGTNGKKCPLIGDSLSVSGFIRRFLHTSLLVTPDYTKQNQKSAMLDAMKPIETDTEMYRPELLNQPLRVQIADLSCTAQ